MHPILAGKTMYLLAFVQLSSDSFSLVSYQSEILAAAAYVLQTDESQASAFAWRWLVSPIMCWSQFSWDRTNHWKFTLLQLLSTPFGLGYFFTCCRAWMMICEYKVKPLVAGLRAGSMLSTLIYAAVSVNIKKHPPRDLCWHFNNVCRFLQEIFT